MAFRVEITEEATVDAENILQWLISEGVGETGIHWFQGLNKASESLASIPGRYPLAPDKTKFPFEVRHLLYGKRPHVYRVIFSIDGNIVWVLRILPGCRNHLEPH